jgi:hypothetical protein
MIESAKAKLDELSNQGLVPDIFKAERARAIFRTIAEHADTINGPAGKNYGGLFGALQSVHFEAEILAITRLYEKKQKRYATRSINTVLDLLNEHPEFPIAQPYQLKLHMQQIGFAPTDLQLVDTGHQALITQRLVEHARNTLESPSFESSLQLLRQVRDKRIAPNENVVSIDVPLSSAIDELLAFAKNFVGTIGWAFLSTGFVNNDTYFLSTDAEMPSRALVRLLRELALIPQRSNM